MIQTGSIFALLLESLNHGSTTTTLSQVADALQTQGDAGATRGTGDGQVQRSELLLLMALLRKIGTQHDHDVQGLRGRISDLEARLQASTQHTELLHAMRTIAERLDARQASERDLHRLHERRALWWGVLLLLALIVGCACLLCALALVLHARH